RAPRPAAARPRRVSRRAQERRASAALCRHRARRGPRARRARGGRRADRSRSRGGARACRALAGIEAGPDLRVSYASGIDSAFIARRLAAYERLIRLDKPTRTLPLPLPTV